MRDWYREKTRELVLSALKRLGVGEVLEPQYLHVEIGRNQNETQDMLRELAECGLARELGMSAEYVASIPQKSE